MILLHISSIKNDPCNGVCVVVPQYVSKQIELGQQVALININNCDISNVNCQLHIAKPIIISTLPTPYNKPDLVIFQECYRIEYINIARQLVRAKIPYIILPHGELAEEAQKKKPIKKMLANIFLFNWFINNAIAIQCLSQRELDSIAFKKKKILTNNGINLPFRSKESFNSNKIKLLYIGRLDAYHKGLDLLLQAISIIKTEMNANNVTLDIYGPDILGRRSYLEQLIQKQGISSLVAVHEAVTGCDKENLLLESDVFIQTSRFEGMPLGILEALSYGIPCIATTGTTIAERIAIKKAGWDAGSTSTDIANAILTCINENQYYREYGENGRRFIRDDFSWTQIMQSTISAYRELLGDEEHDI